MSPNIIPIGAEIAFALTGAAFMFAPRWPYSADAVRLDCIALCDKAQVEMHKALTAEDPKTMYRAMAVVAYLIGKISMLPKTCKDDPK